MPSIEDRVVELERRVADWEGQIGFLMPLTRQLHREIIATQERVDRLDRKVDALEQKVDAGFAATLEQFTRVDHRFEQMDARFERVEADIVALKAGVEALPRVIAEIIRRD